MGNYSRVIIPVLIEAHLFPKVNSIIIISLAICMDMNLIFSLENWNT